MYGAALILTFTALLKQCSSMTHINVLGGNKFGFLTELFFDVAANEELQCFGENFTLESEINIIVKVLNIQAQKVALRITSPSGNSSKWLKGTGQASYSGVADKDGLYEICVKTSAKTRDYVRLSLFIHAEEPQIKIANLTKAYQKQEELKESIQASLHRLMKSIVFSERLLKNLNRKTVLDMYLQIKNIKSIDIFSSIQTAVMICSAIVQVYAIRKLFPINSKKIRI